ncbi:PREDICTED: somatoliberin [Chrysochloris asiatica]|uniref:Somatoliberin n=1 Tax=Chrysochloris asiatica TaxID=185453 RepID=A0A9B0U5K4_CHRAS|nr:PREDICTED: somatoliberin [Chrysochloris asiatica]
MLLWVFFLVILTLSSGSHCSTPSLPLRMQRYADAIFTNSYRRVLGQLSARKLLQDIMSRQQGEKNQEQGARFGRQVESMWADQKLMTLENILVTLLQKHRLKASGLKKSLGELEVTQHSGRGLQAATTIVFQFNRCKYQEISLNVLTICTTWGLGIPKDEDSAWAFCYL